MNRYINVEWVLGCLLCLFIIGCHSADLAQRCAANFPCADSVIVVNRIRVDTVSSGPWFFVHTDTVPCPASDSVTIIIRRDTSFVPVQKKIVQFEYVDTCYKYRNTAYEALLAKEIEALNKQLNEKTREVNKARERMATARVYRGITWFLVLAMIGLIALRGKKS
ncbi:MAG TPA: hypothetical protein PKD70_11185 [Saprospiraceae bacterium]|nr:hypothetical protein [Saprospiraceae bacterium]HMP14435.1 hypothetical protein [Saprospiraceae bacterium]